MKLNVEQAEDKHLKKVGEWICKEDGSFDSQDVIEVFEELGHKLFVTIERDYDDYNKVSATILKLIRTFDTLENGVEISIDKEVQLTKNPDNLLQAISELIGTAIRVSK